MISSTYTDGNLAEGHGTGIFIIGCIAGLNIHRDIFRLHIRSGGIDHAQNCEVIFKSQRIFDVELAVFSNGSGVGIQNNLVLFLTLTVSIRSLLTELDRISGQRAADGDSAVRSSRALNCKVAALVGF